MSKIVIDARESGTSTGRYIDKLIEHLHKLEPNHTIIILTKAERLEFMGTIAPSFVVIETPFKEFTFSEQIGLLRQVKGFEADLVHFGKTEQPVLYRGKSVTTVHDLINALLHNPSRYRNRFYFKFKQIVYRWVIRRVAHKSQTLITPTLFIKNQLARFSHINPNKITVTLESADLITAQPEAFTAAQNKKFIVYVGRPTLHKNLARLIDAFVLLQKTHPDLRLVLAGKTDANYYEHAARVERDGIKNVIFTDFISDGQLRWLYEHCQAYVFPSLSEGFGLPGLEAMLHGAPVVSSNATCLPEVYGDAAHYFDPLDVSDIATKIGEVLDDSTLRKDLVEKGRQQAAKYSWQRMAEQTLAVYEKTLKS